MEVGPLRSGFIRGNTFLKLLSGRGWGTGGKLSLGVVTFGSLQ